MEICVKSFDGEKYTVEVGVDDTTADIRRKVASAAELREDGFDMSFGGKLLAEGDAITQLSAGDTVVLTKTKSQKDDAIAALRDLGETSLSIGRFEGLEDPKLVRLFLQAEVVTEIPDHFLQGATFSELDLSGVPGVTYVGNFILKCCISLRTADLSGWSNVTHIEGGFLSNCTALQTLDLSGWNSVAHIEHSFLSNCTNLRTLDLSGWSNVTRLKYFLYDCTSLTTLNISAWNNVTQLGYQVLSSCSALRTLDLSGWNNVTHIGHCFLSNCTSLTTLDVSGLNNVTQVGKSFLYDCSALQTLDLSGWSNVTRVEEHFLSKCTSLTTLDFSGWSNLTRVDEYFLSNCTSLTTLDISTRDTPGFDNPRSVSACVPEAFALSTSLSTWNNVTQLGDYFLFNCSALKTLDLSGLTSVRYIRPSFLEGCTLPTSSINSTGSCSVVSEHVNGYGYSLVDDTKCKCVCM